ncbi:MAG: ATP cone domain-containing protein, partial [Alphaproteobacteria bacterium]
MKCPFCSHDDTQVKDSRPSDDGKVIRRRRECDACGRRFTTFEKFQVQQVVVLKRDGRRELFDRDKLTKSLLTALRKRPVPATEIARLVNDMEQQLTENGRSEVTSRE